MKKAELNLLGIARIFHRYDHNQRANMQASHCMGHRQRHRTGEFFYVSSHVPRLAFPTQGQAVAAARAALAEQAAAQLAAAA